MLKLMKYELRKTWFSKLVLLVLTGAAELIFLVGILRKAEGNTAAGIGLLVFIATFGILYIGLDSLLVLNKDLNTKQGYMLFMTPNSSYKILGSKILENGISIFLAGLFFIGLAYVDIQLVLNVYKGGQDIVKMVQEFLNQFKVPVNLTFAGLSVYFLSALAGWLSAVIIAAFSIVVSSTLLTGQKLNIFVSLALFLVLNYVAAKVAGLVPFSTDYSYYLVTSLIHLGIAAAAYVAACMLMDRKLSL